MVSRKCGGSRKQEQGESPILVCRPCTETEPSKEMELREHDGVKCGCAVISNWFSLFCYHTGKRPIFHIKANIAFYAIKIKHIYEKFAFIFILFYFATVFQTTETNAHDIKVDHNESETIVDTRETQQNVFHSSYSHANNGDSIYFPPMTLHWLVKSLFSRSFFWTSGEVNEMPAKSARVSDLITLRVMNQVLETRETFFFSFSSENSYIHTVQRRGGASLLPRSIRRLMMLHLRGQKQQQQIMQHTLLYIASAATHQVACSSAVA
jgi:hypothetical protein